MIARTHTHGVGHGDGAAVGVDGGPLLSLDSVRAGYGRVPVLHDVSLTVGDGEVTVLLGANGAGKTTTLRTLCGMLRAAGSIRFDGREMAGKSARWVARNGIAMVPQGRGTFNDLTVSENLQVGAYLQKSRSAIAEDTRFWLERFPRLAERHNQKAGTLSGGEQQMLAVSRAMMSRPRLLLLDEPSLGLAPRIVEEMFDTFARINAEQKTSMLVVEQSAELALAIADRGFVLESGRTVLSGTAAELQSHEGIRKAYLGS